MGSTSDLISAAKILGAGAATIGIGGAGTGVGHVFGAFMLACSRNPGMEVKLFRYVLIGFALTEAVGLLALMMAFLLLFTLPYYITQILLYYITQILLYYITQILPYYITQILPYYILI